MTLRSARRLYTGRVINLDLDEVEFPNGTTGHLEMVRHPGAAAVVPFLDRPESEDPRIVLVRQFRHAADGYIWEIPAGRLGPGETPEQCAHRELREETGFAARTLERLVTIFTTPGFTDERIHLFYAEGLSPGPTAHEVDEHIETEVLHWSHLRTRIAQGEVQDGKTLSALLLCDALLVRRGAQ